MKPALSVAASLAVLVVLVALWVTNCSGPEPSVQQINVQPGAEAGDPYKVSALVHNDGNGHGEVSVEFRLISRTSGTVFKKEESMPLQGGQSATLVVEINAPQDDYRAEVDANYPPR